MYNNRNTSFGRSNRGYQQTNFGRFNAPRPRFRNARKPRKFGENLDTSLFIKKACEIVTIEEAEVLHNFDDFGFDQILLKNIKNKGYTKPTQIQDQVISFVISGQDVLGIASTGTGKTAAFALPLIDQIVKHPEKRILVLAPTRELAMQIRQEIRSFTFGLKVYVSLAIGGAFLKEQIRDIQRDPHIIVGTPGRIKDLGDRRVINFAKMDTLVLDEVDRMLDMGFIHDIKEIVSKIPANRQTLFFSATMDRKMEGLVDSFLNNPAKVSIKAQNSSDHVEQNVVMVNRNNKQEVLIKLLQQEEFKKVLIFGATKRMVENVSNNLIDTGFRAGSLHGNKTQQKRQNVLRMFKENVINVLVATDVAARGLDVADITHVINFDKPNNYEDYIHRIGRTGRANAKGYALTFVETRY
ncbi:ATP-dependent RNA helicase CshA [bioreactor metagenome]|uniref:ATP-dependent RNA helicase CshA n=1 Tax=bioreactor metagenome TaxID=1076179 RepID=A0A644Y1S5_9ZZZZ